MASRFFGLSSAARIAVLAVVAGSFAQGASAEQVQPDIKMMPAPAGSGVTPSAAQSPAAAQAYGDPTPPATPLDPFSATMVVLNSVKSVGTGAGQLNVTSIVLTNYDSSPQQVFLFAPVFASGGKCGDSVIGGSTPNMQVYVQPSQTLVMPFPTPIVVKGLKPNCFGAEVTTLLHGGSVGVTVTGYYQHAR